MRLFFLLSLLIFSTACKEKKSIHGKAFVDREVLVDVLVDIHLADGITNDRKFHRQFDVDSVDVLSPILEKHQITRDMLDTTMWVYSRYPKLMDEVYNDVLNELNVMMDRVDKENEESAPGNRLNK